MVTNFGVVCLLWFTLSAADQEQPNPVMFVLKRVGAVEVCSLQPSKSVLKII